MDNQNTLHQEYLSEAFKRAGSSSLDDFDADEFTQQQTENLINEDFSNGFVADRKSTEEILRNLNKVTNAATASTNGEYKSKDLSRMNQALKPSNFSTSEKLSNGDFIKQQMSNPQTNKAIKESFAGKQGILLLTVRNSNGGQQGQLQVEDLESIFSRFGKVTVEVSNSSDNQNNIPCSIIPNSIQQSSAVLHFEDVVHAYFALISLHGLYLSTLNATLELRWKTDCSSKENQEKDKKDQKPLSLQITKKPLQVNQSQQENQETDENARPSQLSNNNNNKNQSSISYISKSQYQLGLQSSQYFQTDGNILRDSQANCQINIPSLSSSHQQHSQTMKQMPMQLLNNNNNTPQYSNNYNNSNSTFSNSIQQNNNNTNNNGNGSNSNSNNNNNGGMKYTCRYEIQIPNEKDFQVARKIIGSRGENMKSIIRKCIEFGKKNGDQYANEEDHGVKLRLRGKGSGYKEGPEKQESSESLHLCVSSTYQEMYNAASFFVEELLQTIYDEYYKYCLQINLRRDKLVVKKQESTNGKTSSNAATPCASGSTVNQSQTAISSQSQQFPSASLYIINLI